MDSYEIYTGQLIPVVCVQTSTEYIDKPSSTFFLNTHFFVNTGFVVNQLKQLVYDTPSHETSKL